MHILMTASTYSPTFLLANKPGNLIDQHERKHCRKLIAELGNCGYFKFFCIKNANFRMLYQGSDSRGERLFSKADLDLSTRTLSTPGRQYVASDTTHILSLKYMHHCFPPFTFLRPPLPPSPPSPRPLSGCHKQVPPPTILC